jgi:hypothetical protein
MYDYMTKVVKSDPRLHAMARHLGDLYFEMQSVQNRFVAVKGANKKPVKGYKGPRIL